MSHTHKDQPGGHVATLLETNGGDCWNTPAARRFGKKFHAREARREAKRITRAAVIEAESEQEWLLAHRIALEDDLLSCYGDDDDHTEYDEIPNYYEDHYDDYDPYDDYYEWEY